MSIFTHTFPRYVRKQLEDREAILAIGNNLSENRFAKSKYPAGAFYTNTVEKQCIIRMCSGVDLSEEGEKQILSTKLEKDNWRGSNLARNWILEGGMPDPNLVTEANIDALTAARKKSTHPDDPTAALEEGHIASFTPRGGFTNQPSGKSAYGDPSTRSDAGDGFGIVPMPGIIDAKIKVKSAYGSLKEASVNFVCHNRRQLEILELLYMRPGYTILLEWGWTPHIKTATDKEGNELSIIKSNDFFVMNEFFDPNKTFSELNRAVLDKKVKSGGNYDALCGYVKNFEIKVREDGGYDCSTTIISMGELLEGLKGQRTFPGIKSKEDDEEIVYDNFEVYMMALKQKMKVDGEIDEYDEQSDFMKWLKNSWIGSKFFETYSDIASKASNPFGDHDISALITEAFTNIFLPGKGLEFYPEGVAETEVAQAKLEEWENTAKANNSGIGWTLTPAAGIWWTRRAINHAIKKTTVAKEQLKNLKAADVIDHFLLHKGETLGLGKDGNSQLGKSQHSYVRWDLLCEIMNEFVLDNATGTAGKDGKGPVKKQLAKIAYTLEGEESPDDVGIYLDYANYAFAPGTKIPIALMEDSATEEGSNQNQGLGTQLIDMSDIMDGSMNPAICLFPHQITPGNDPENSRKKLGTVLLGKSQWRDVDASESVSATNRSIGLIYINVDHLLETYREMRYDSNGGDNENWNILAFCKKIWEDDITGACAGTHNFIFQMPNSVGRVIDIAFDGSGPPDTHTIQIQGQHSTVRDFNFNTTIDKKLSSTIAIAAQSPKSISNLDQLSFAAFNKNITNRFVQQKMGTKEAKENREKTELDVQSYASQLYNYHLSIVRDGGKDNKKKNQTINVENAVQKILSLQKMIIELTLTYPLKCSEHDNEVYTVDILKDEEGYVEGENNSKQEGCEGDSNKNHPNAGLRRRSASISKSSIIPLKFNASLDGIGGIVIGNIFKLPADRLPKGYDGDNIAFVVMGLNHKITKGQDWITEISGQLILLADKTNQTSMLTYTEDDIKKHKGSGRTFDRSVNPTYTVIEGVSYRNRKPNAAKVVKLFDNEYTNSILEQHDIKLSPGGNSLDGFISEKVGSSDGTDPFPQLDSGGDITPQLADVAVKVFTTIKEWTDNPPGIGKREEWIGVNSPDPTYKIRDGKSNPYHITLTGGNDAWHHSHNKNSNHCQGNGLDFVVTPAGRKYRDEIERILQKFAVANDGHFRYINEYADGGTPSGHASGDHWHMTWYPSKIGHDGDASLQKAKDLSAAGKLWSPSWGETQSDFKISVSSYVATGKASEVAVTAGSSCFIAGTKVKMADGTDKNIEDVKINEEILGQNGANKVIDYDRPKLGDRKLYSFNGEKAFVTYEHPFMTEEGWKSIDPEETLKENPNLTVGILNIGDVIITNSKSVTIESIEAYEGNEEDTVYNFKLDGDHTYYADNYLVHNKA